MPFSKTHVGWRLGRENTSETATIPSRLLSFKFALTFRHYVFFNARPAFLLTGDFLRATLQFARVPDTNSNLPKRTR